MIAIFVLIATTRARDLISKLIDRHDAIAVGNEIKDHHMGLAIASAQTSAQLLGPDRFAVGPPQEDQHFRIGNVDPLVEHVSGEDLLDIPCLEVGKDGHTAIARQSRVVRFRARQVLADFTDVGQVLAEEDLLQLASELCFDLSHLCHDGFQPFVEEDSGVDVVQRNTSVTASRPVYELLEFDLIDVVVFDPVIHVREIAIGDTLCQGIREDFITEQGPDVLTISTVWRGREAKPESRIEVLNHRTIGVRMTVVSFVDDDQVEVISLEEAPRSFVHRLEGREQDVTFAHVFGPVCGQQAAGDAFR